MEVPEPEKAEESLTDFRGFIGFIQPPGRPDDDPDDYGEIDPRTVLGQIEALWMLLAGLMLTHWTTPESRARNAEKIKSSMLQPDLVGPLERQHGREFIVGYREIVRKVVQFLRG